MDIYSSDKAVPYVYICTHKETNQFYIGYRMANVKLNRPSHLDLPKYKTSSNIVNPDWSNYTWTIVAEFFDPSHAYTFEQQIIFDNWDNPLLLNGHYNLGEEQFRTSGPTGKPSPKKGIPLSAETRQKMSDAGKGRTPWNKGTPSGPSPRKGIPSGKKGIPYGPRKGPDPRKGIPTGKPAWNKGVSHSAETKQKISDSKKGIPTGPKPKITCPHCGTIGGSSPMTRWHFDNCKKKIIAPPS